MTEGSTVYLIDDDTALRQSFSRLFSSAGLTYAPYPSVEAFLEDVQSNGPSCLLMDLHLNSADGVQNGIEALKLIRRHAHLQMPVIVISGAGDIASAVKSLKLGASDFFEKPVDPHELLTAIRNALLEDESRRQTVAKEREAGARIDSLTERERQLMQLVCIGMSNKQIALKLDISIKTVANHRAHMLAKSRAANTADMVRLMMLADHRKNPADAIDA